MMTEGLLKLLIALLLNLLYVLVLGFTLLALLSWWKRKQRIARGEPARPPYWQKKVSWLLTHDLHMAKGELVARGEKVSFGHGIQVNVNDRLDPNSISSKQNLGHATDDAAVLTIRNQTIHFEEGDRQRVIDRGSLQGVLCCQYQHEKSVTGHTACSLMVCLFFLDDTLGYVAVDAASYTVGLHTLLKKNEAYASAYDQVTSKAKEIAQSLDIPLIDNTYQGKFSLLAEFNQ